MSERQVYMRVSLNEAHQLWFCGECGAVLVRAAWPTHDTWHNSVALRPDRPITSQARASNPAPAAAAPSTVRDIPDGI